MLQIQALEEQQALLGKPPTGTSTNTNAVTRTMNRRGGDGEEEDEEEEEDEDGFADNSIANGSTNTSATATDGPPQRLLGLMQGSGPLPPDKFTSIDPGNSNSNGHSSSHGGTSASRRLQQSRALGGTNTNTNTTISNTIQEEGSGFMVVDGGPSYASTATATSTGAGSGRFFAQLEGSSKQFDTAAALGNTTTTTNRGRYNSNNSSGNQQQHLDDSVSFISDDMSADSTTVTRDVPH